MPSLPVVPNVVRVQLHWKDDADLAVYTDLHFRYSGTAPSAADALVLATALYTDAAGMCVLLDDNSALTGVRVTDLSSSTGGDATYSANTNGTNGHDILPGGVCALVNFHISRRYRGGKPRAYLPLGNASDLVSRQAWTGTFVTDVNTDYGNFQTAAIGTTGGGTTLTQQVSVSYYSGFTVVVSGITHRARNVPTLRATPVVDQIISFAASARPGSQRRRN